MLPLIKLEGDLTSQCNIISLVEEVEESIDFVPLLLSRECKSQLSEVPLPSKWVRKLSIDTRY
jgi:hypothetical protein